jgi:Fe-S cluster biogenesis protein NfuA
LESRGDEAYVWGENYLACYKMVKGKVKLVQTLWSENGDIRYVIPTSDGKAAVYTHKGTCLACDVTQKTLRQIEISINESDIPLEKPNPNEPTMAEACLMADLLSKVAKVSMEQRNKILMSKKTELTKRQRVLWITAECQKFLQATSSASRPAPK